MDDVGGRDVCASGRRHAPPLDPDDGREFTPRDSTGRRPDDDAKKKERERGRGTRSTRDGREDVRGSFFRRVIHSLIGVGFFVWFQHDDADDAPKWNGNGGNDERTGRADGGDATWGGGDVVVWERGGENACGKKTDDERAALRSASGGGSRQRKKRGSGDVVR